MKRKKHRMIGLLICGSLLFGSACTPDEETTSALVELAASTSGALVTILVQVAIQSLLNFGQNGIDLGLPISQQVH